MTLPDYTYELLWYDNDTVYYLESRVLLIEQRVDNNVENILTNTFGDNRSLIINHLESVGTMLFWMAYLATVTISYLIR